MGSALGFNEAIDGVAKPRAGFAAGFFDFFLPAMVLETAGWCWGEESGVGAWQAGDAGLTSISRPAMGLATGAPAVVDPQQTGARQGPEKKKNV